MFWQAFPASHSCLTYHTKLFFPLAIYRSFCFCLRKVRRFKTSPSKQVQREGEGNPDSRGQSKARGHFSAEAELSPSQAAGATGRSSSRDPRVRFHDGLKPRCPWRSPALPFTRRLPAQALPCACTHALAENALLVPRGCQEASQTVPFGGGSGLDQKSSLLLWRAVPQHTSSPAPVSLSASANSASAGTVLALGPRKPGKGHTPEKPPAEPKSCHYLLPTPEDLLSWFPMPKVLG